MHVTSVNDRFTEYKHHGHLWAGWLGSPWAITDAILEQLCPRKGFVVLCGGPGDLAFNAYSHGRTRFSVNVDSSYDAIAYGLSLTGRYTAARDYAAEVESANRHYAQFIELIPDILVQPDLAALGLISVTSFQINKVYQVWDDALHFVNSTLATLPPVDVYIASPTVLDCYGSPFLFYSIYDAAFGTKRSGFSKWVTNEETYLLQLMEGIKRAQPEASILFGVGEGRVPVGDYVAMVQGKIVHEECFVLESGYKFDDWIIRYDPVGGSI